MVMTYDDLKSIIYELLESDSGIKLLSFLCSIDSNFRKLVFKLIDESYTLVDDEYEVF